jgi:hypothetical protein
MPTAWPVRRTHTHTHTRTQEWGHALAQVRMCACGVRACWGEKERARTHTYTRTTTGPANDRLPISLTYTNHRLGHAATLLCMYTHTDRERERDIRGHTESGDWGVPSSNSARSVLYTPFMIPLTVSANAAPDATTEAPAAPAVAGLCTQRRERERKRDDGV